MDAINKFKVNYNQMWVNGVNGLNLMQRKKDQWIPIKTWDGLKLKVFQVR